MWDIYNADGVQFILTEPMKIQILSTHKSICHPSFRLLHPKRLALLEEEVSVVDWSKRPGSNLTVQQLAEDEEEGDVRQSTK